MSDEIYLSTFFFGGSSLINKYAFDLLGGYDKNFFVGYEDVDLSIRCYKAGIKVANINMYSLVHEHLKLNDDLSKKYESKRYNYDSIFRSADYFFKKYNQKYSVLSNGEMNFLKQMNKGE